MDGLVMWADRAGSGQAGPATTERAALLVELLLLRGHVLARIADYEHAVGLAELLVCAAPDDGAA